MYTYMNITEGGREGRRERGREGGREGGGGRVQTWTAVFFYGSSAVRIHTIIQHISHKQCSTNSVASEI